MFGIVSTGISFVCVMNLSHISLFAVNSLKEFGKLLSSVEDERDKIVSHFMFWSKWSCVCICYICYLFLFDVGLQVQV